MKRLMSHYESAHLHWIGPTKKFCTYSTGEFIIYITAKKTADQSVVVDGGGNYSTKNIITQQTVKLFIHR